MKSFLCDFFIDNNHVLEYAFILGLMYSFIEGFKAKLLTDRENLKKSENSVFDSKHYNSPMTDFLLKDYRDSLIKSKKKINILQKLYDFYLYSHVFLLILLGFHLFSFLHNNQFFKFLINSTLFICIILLAYTMYLHFGKKGEENVPKILSELKRSPFYYAPF